MSKHNKKNTLSFVILSLLTATPALTSAGGWLGGFRILAHLTAALGFNVGKMKVQRNNLSVTDAIVQKFKKVDTSKEDAYFNMIPKSAEEWESLREWLECVNKEDLPSIRALQKDQAMIALLANPGAPVNQQNVLLAIIPNHVVQIVTDQIVVGPGAVLPVRPADIHSGFIANRAKIITHFDQSKDLLKKIDQTIFPPKPIPATDIVTHLQTADAAKDFLWSVNFQDTLRKYDGGLTQLGAMPDFASATEYSCNVPNFWRRFEFAGEVSALFQALDWFAIGLHAGLAGSLHQSQLDDISRVRSSANFSIKFGAAVQLTKWFQCAFMASAERHSFTRDSLDMGSKGSNDSLKKEIDRVQEIYNIQENNIKRLNGAWGKNAQTLLKANTEQQKKDIQQILDGFEASGWSWGIKIQPAFLLWFNEMIALKLGAELTFPLTEIKDDKVNLKFTPCPRAAIMAGIVLSII